MPLSEKELEKYSRHFLVDDFSEVEQLKLKEAKVLVIGAGGLGAPALLYLAGGGVGTIGIVENDVVSVSNLPRQILYSPVDVGKPKAVVAREKILRHHPECTIHPFSRKWEEKSAKEISSDYTVIIDCTDNLESRYLTDEISKNLDIPFVYGAVHQMEGQVAVFNYRGSIGYSEFFKKKELSPSKSSLGIIGPAAGTIGNLQAGEAIKIITGIGEVLANKMLFVSLRFNRYQVFNY